MFSNGDTSFKRSPLFFPLQSNRNKRHYSNQISSCYATSDSRTKKVICLLMTNYLLLSVGWCINTRGIHLRLPVMLTKWGESFISHESPCGRAVPVVAAASNDNRHRLLGRHSLWPIPSLCEHSELTNQSPHNPTISVETDNTVLLFIWGDQVILEGHCYFVFMSCLPFQHHQAQKKHNYFYEKGRYLHFQAWLLNVIDRNDLN